MKTNNFFLTALAAATALLCSCMKDADPARMSPADVVNITVDEPTVIDVRCDGTSQEAVMTRSAADAEDVTTVHDLTIWSYNASGSLVKTYHTTSTKGLSLYDILGDTWSSGTFTVLILGNMGDRTSSAPSRLSDARNVRFDVSGYTQWDHFPLYGIHENVSASTVSLTVRRMVSAYNFSFTQSSGNTNVYQIKSFELHNVNRYIRPFNEGYAATETINHEDDSESADYFSDTDITAINNKLALRQSAGPAKTFAFENCQGDISGISTRQDKKKSKLTKAQQDLCTFFEASTSVTTGKDVLYPEVKYRWYFGYGNNMNTCNFDVPRNITFNITVNFDQMEVTQEDWRIVPEETIRLVPTVPNTLAVGRTNYIKADIYKNGEPVAFDVDAAWTFGSKLSYNSKDRTITGKQIGDQQYECRYTYNGTPLCAGGKVAVDDLVLYFDRETHWDEDAGEEDGVDWRIRCNSTYRLIRVSVAVCGWDRKGEDAEFSDEFFMSQDNRIPKNYTDYTIPTNLLSTSLPPVWVDEEGEVNELRANLIYYYHLTPYFRAYVTYRRSSDPAGMIRYQEMVFIQDWPN